MWIKGKTIQIAGDWFRHNLKTAHGRVMLLGWFIVACYLPFWLARVAVALLNGFGTVFTAAALILGLYRLWRQRRTLAELEAPEADRWLGYFLIGIALLVFPLGFSTYWIQRIVWLQVFAGMALSTWGWVVFGRYPIAIFLIFIGLFPELTPVAKTLWETFTPPQSLETMMTWGGTVGLRAIGQSATQVAPTVIALPGGAVDVYWGCSGFDMATTLAITSLLVGLALGEPLWTVVLMVVIGIALALVANIPRIMLMALANAYWGKEAFNFWHGPWGGQIFAGTIFTIYYYIVMAIRKRKGSHLVD